MSNKVYEIVTEKITEVMAKGEIPWRKPWKGSGVIPRNYTTKKPYKGCNLFLLSFAPYSNSYFLTYKQAQEMDGQVKKGEKGWPVIFWNWTEKVNNKTGEVEEIPFLRYYKVFNLDQIDGLEIDEVKHPNPNFKPIDKAEEMLKAMPNKPKIVHDEPRAYYSPSIDLVNMPVPTLFYKDEEYYSTLFHELAHSTGHEKRLNRKDLQEFKNLGDYAYSKEELTAELTSAMLCMLCGIDNTIENSAAYLQGWLKKLKDNPKWFVLASAKAQKAADYIQGIKEGKQAQAA